MQIHCETLGPFGTNTYFVTALPGQAVLIDPGYMGGTIEARARALSLAPRAILVTHGHGDHVLSAEVLRRTFACALYFPAGDLGLATGEFLAEHYEKPQPTALLRGGETLEVCGLSVLVLAGAGPPPGHVGFLVGGNLFSGDCLFQGSVGRTDLAGGDGPTLFRSLGELLKLPDATVVWPGHGPKTTIGRERRENPFLI